MELPCEINRNTKNGDGTRFSFTRIGMERNKSTPRILAKLKQQRFFQLCKVLNGGESTKESRLPRSLVWAMHVLKDAADGDPSLAKKRECRAANGNDDKNSMSSLCRDNVDKGTPKNDVKVEELEGDSSNILNNNSNNNNNNKCDILNTQQLLVQICQFLHFADISRMKGVNKYVNNELFFEIVVSKGNVYYECKNYLVLDIIENQICDNLQDLVMWYFLTWNSIQNLGVFFNFRQKDALLSQSQRYLLSLNFCRLNGVDDMYNEEKCSLNMDYPTQSGKCHAFQLLGTLLKRHKSHFEIFLGVSIFTPMILSTFFNIKPLVKELESCLIKNSNQLEGCHIRKPFTCLEWMFAASGDIGVPFGGTNRFHFGITDHPSTGGNFSIISQLACQGSFKHYKLLSSNLAKDKLSECYNLMNGMLATFALFLKLDLLDTFILPQSGNAKKDLELQMPEKVLLFSINSQYLMELKSKITSMATPTKNRPANEEFDLINNKRYFPENRIKFLIKLAFSSQFAVLLANMARLNSGATSKMCNMVTKLYHNYDYFVQCWELNKYQHLKNDITKQENVHEQFRSIMEIFFHINQYFVEWNGDIGSYQVRRNIKHLSFVAKNVNQRNFMDLMPGSEKDLLLLYNTTMENARVPGAVWSHNFRFDSTTDTLTILQDLWDVFNMYPV